MAPSEHEWQVGPYTLVRPLGEGAFGWVWLAERQTILATTQAALKFLPMSTLSDVKQEAELWVNASGHQNVLPIWEAALYDGQVVLVSEYARDGSLEDWLKRHGGKAPSVQRAVAMASGILSGVDHLHGRGIIHRDLKPGNVLLQGETPRIADFGLARLVKSPAQTQSIAGTPPYMAPEAWSGDRNQRTDLWSIGAILYTMLAGCPPFQGDDPMAVMKKILENDPPALPPTVPDSVSKVVFRALDKDPAKRYQTAGEMLSDLSAASQEAVPRGGIARTLDLRVQPCLPSKPEPPLVEWLFVDRSLLETCLRQRGLAKTAKSLRLGRASVREAVSKLERRLRQRTDIPTDLRIETMIARRASIPLRQPPALLPALHVWVSVSPEGTETEGVGRRPSGPLFLIENYQGPREGYEPYLSGYSRLQLLANALGRDPSFQEISQRLFVLDAQEDSLKGLLAQHPVWTLSCLGAELETERRIKAIYRVRASSSDFASDRGPITIGYSIVIEEA